MSLDGYNITGEASPFVIAANWVSQLVSNSNISTSRKLGIHLTNTAQNEFAPLAGKILFLQAELASNAHTDTITMQMQVNDVNQGDPITFAASELTEKTIILDIDFVKGDKLNCQLTLNGTGNIVFKNATVVIGWTTINTID